MEDQLRDLVNMVFYVFRLIVKKIIAMFARRVASPLLRVRFQSTKAPKPNHSPVPGPRKDTEVKPKAHAPPPPKASLIQDTTSYVPQERYQRVNFEYPSEPSSRDSNKSRSRYRMLVPIGIALVGGGWALYTFNFFTDPAPNEYLHPDKFIPFIITSKVDIDQDHYLIELTPKYSKWKTTQRDVEPFNGNKLWNVEVKQPQIMVVRKYTPLPLEIFKSQDGEPIIRIQDTSAKFSTTEGKMVLYIKKYDQGEVARWIHRKPLGSVLELRGPFTDYEFEKTPNNNVERPGLKYLPSKVLPDPPFPIEPDNIAFFAAGTGIAPVLQLLLSKNPYRGFIDVYYSTRTESEIPISNYLFFLEKLDRAKFHRFVQEKKQSLKLKDVPGPVKSSWVEHKDRLQQEKKRHEELVAEKLALLKQGKTPIAPTETTRLQAVTTTVEHAQKFATALEQAEARRAVPKKGPSLALVCGPEGYVSYVAGHRPFDSQGPPGGLLKAQGWTADHVYKFE